MRLVLLSVPLIFFINEAYGKGKQTLRIYENLRIYLAII